MAKKWSNEEIELLKREYPTKAKNELIEIFKPYGREYNSIESKASKMGIKKFEIHEKDGFKHCKKCGRELPYDYFHFPQDKATTTGLRNVCRECDKSYGNFLNKRFYKFVWSKDDENLLRKVYYNYTNNEIIYMFFPNLTLKMLGDKAYSIKCNSKSKYALERSRKEVSIKISGENNYWYNKEKSKNIIDKQRKSLHKYYETHDGARKGVKLSKCRCLQISNRLKSLGQWKGENNPRHINPLNGELNGRWSGGKTPLIIELRTQIVEWKKASMKDSNYKCVLTGGKFNEIHHLYPFKDIFEETFKIVNLDIRDCVSDYTKEEFKLICDTIKSLHHKYGNGVCLCYPLHKLFHNTYGYTETNKEQFEEFKIRLKNGEFNDYLQNYNLKLAI